MLATSNIGNMDQVHQGFHSLPSPYNHVNGFEIKMWNMNGTITTPWYQEDFVEEYYKEDRDFHMVLELPGDIKDQVGSGSLIIELDIDIREEEGWIEQLIYNEIKEGERATPYKLTLHTAEKSWPDAEDECQKEGGHLALVSSEEVNEELEEYLVESMFGWEEGGSRASGAGQTIPPGD